MSLWKINAPLILKYKRTNLKAQRASFIKFYLALVEKKKIIFRYIINTFRSQRHGLHIVSPSPWPIYSAFSAFLFVLGMVLWMHNYTIIPLLGGVLCLFSTFIFWFRDIVRENIYMGHHTDKINSCLRAGFILFLISEVMLFFAFFWSLMHFSLTPSIFSGGIWPPQGIVIYLLSENVMFPSSKFSDLIKVKTPLLINETHDVQNLIYDTSDLDKLMEKQDQFRRVYKQPTNFTDVDSINNNLFVFFLKRQNYGNPGTLFWKHSKMFINLYCHGVLVNPYKIPLLNTALLITSGFVLTVSHSYLRMEFYRASYRTLLATIYLGLFFLFLQAKEYIFSGFSINDGVYGSIFYLLTGFHGFHVIIGTIFLIVCAFRLRLSHFTSSRHFAFEAAAWYWHFVDVIWILLYFLLYLWPNAKYFSSKATMSFDPIKASVFINMTAEYYLQFLSVKDPNYVIPTTINLENSFETKSKIVRNIVTYFKKELIDYEDRNEFDFYRIRRNQWRRLLKKIRHW